MKFQVLYAYQAHCNRAVCSLCEQKRPARATDVSTWWEDAAPSDWAAARTGGGIVRVLETELLGDNLWQTSAWAGYFVGPFVRWVRWTRPGDFVTPESLYLN